MSNFLKKATFQIYRTYARNAGSSRSNRNYKWKDEGIQYEGFKYYPRYPDFKDPPYEPSKLLRVQRIKELKGLPYYERQILAELKLDEGSKLNGIAIVKNIPEINSKLWKIKHLVKIDPITFPDGFPTDLKGTHLKENGELKVVRSVNENKLQLAEEIKKKPTRMDGDTLRRDSRLKWLNAWNWS